MINPNELARVKDISLPSVIRGYGIKVDSRYGKFNCPFHDDKNASAKVYKNNTFHCFGCGANGDVVDFTAKMSGVDFKTAFKMLGGSDAEPSREEQAKLMREQERRGMRQKCLAWINSQVPYWELAVSHTEYQIRLLGLYNDDFDDWEWESLKRLSDALVRAYQQLDIYKTLRQKYEEDIRNAKY